MKIFKEFREFLNNYKITALAIAFIIGAALTNLVQVLVSSVIMPVIIPFEQAGSWEKATFRIGPIAIGWGAFLSALINFIIIALFVFLTAKFVLKEEKESKK